jgi:hypothetical protein
MKLPLMAFIVALILLEFTRSSLARHIWARESGSAGYCRGLIAAKNLKTSEKRGYEYNRCLTNPQHYK